MDVFFAFNAVFWTLFILWMSDEFDRSERRVDEICNRRRQRTWTFLSFSLGGGSASVSTAGDPSASVSVIGGSCGGYR